MDTHLRSPGYIESHEAFQPGREAHSSGVSWGAVIGGAFVTSALYLILLALGAGFGLSAVSPWANVGVSAATAGIAAIIWLVLIEVTASALGGYLTGRLRTKWTLIHDDEVFFRDTANGFLSWAVALVVSATLMASAAASMAGRVEQARVTPDNSASAETTINPTAYFVDTLFRSDRPATESGDASVRAQATRIFNNGLRQSQMPTSDQDCLAHLVVAQTGISQSEAEKRVVDTVARARQAEDAARNATAHLLLWLFISLLLGAFSASYAATIGGRQRDNVRSSSRGQ